MQVFTSVSLLAVVPCALVRYAWSHEVFMPYVLIAALPQSLLAFVFIEDRLVLGVAALLA
jgi:hypothetical protein